MQYTNALKLVLALSSLVLTGCAEQPAHLAMPVPNVQATYELQLVKQEALTGGVEGYYSKLAPVFHKDGCFAADRKGVVIRTKISSSRSEKADQVYWKRFLSADSRVRTDEKGNVQLSVGPVYDQKHLFLATERGQCICVNAETGRIVWIADLDGEVLAAPVPDGKGRIFVHTENAVLYALDTGHGRVLWKDKGTPSSLSFRGAASPVLYRDKVVLGGKDGIVRAFLQDTGQLVWERSLKRPRGTSEMDRMNDAAVASVLLKETLFVSSYSGFVARLHAETGAVIWKVPLEVSVKGLVVDQHAVYCVDTADQLLALKVKDGSLLWKQASLRYRGLSGPVKILDLLSLHDSEGYVYLISAESGVLAGIYPLNEPAAGPMVTVGNQLTILDRKGRLHVLRVKPSSQSAATGSRV